MYIYIYTGFWIELARSKHCRLPQVLRPFAPLRGRARQRRAKARKRIRTARDKGTTASWRDICFLQNHHSNPVYRESLMGRGKQWGSKETGWGKQHGHGGWQQSGGNSYSGQYADWDTQDYRQKGSRRSEEKPRFPSYAMMELDAAPSKEAAGPKAKDMDPLKPGDLVRGIQRFVTAARKAEVKTRKATEERELILARWHKYQAELQASFVQERANYKKDLMRNQEELERLQDAQRMAFQDLKDAFDNPEGMLTKPEQLPPEEAVAEWEHLLQACDDEDVDMTEAMAERLGQSLKALLAGSVPKTPARHARTARHHGRRGPPEGARYHPSTSSWKRRLGLLEGRRQQKNEKRWRRATRTCSHRATGRPLCHRHLPDRPPEQGERQEYQSSSKAGTPCPVRSQDRHWRGDWKANGRLFWRQQLRRRSKQWTATTRMLRSWAT